ncbi:Deoxyribonuclease-1 [Bulinus truncatus]|nr:Deoxyribonuclease-1 [Bulinus truncatus]
MGDFNADCSYLNNQQKASLAIFNTPGRYRSLIPDTADTTTSINTDCTYDKSSWKTNKKFLQDGPNTAPELYNEDAKGDISVLNCPMSTNTDKQSILHEEVKFVVQKLKKGNQREQTTFQVN